MSTTLEQSASRLSPHAWNESSSSIWSTYWPPQTSTREASVAKEVYKWYRVTLLPLVLALAALSSVLVVVVMLCAREVRTAISVQSRLLFSLLAACDVVRPVAAAYLYFRMPLTSAISLAHGSTSYSMCTSNVQRSYCTSTKYGYMDETHEQLIAHRRAVSSIRVDAARARHGASGEL